jgi:hypothetical protein
MKDIFRDNNKNKTNGVVATFFTVADAVFVGTHYRVF